MLDEFQAKLIRELRHISNHLDRIATQMELDARERKQKEAETDA